MFSSKIKNVLALITTNFAASGIMVIFWLYFASITEKEVYGEATYLISIAAVAFGIANVGLGGVIVVYGAKKENVLPPAYSFGIISCSIASIVTFVLTQNLSLVFLIFGMLIFVMTTAELTSKQRYITLSKYRIARSSLTVIFAISLYYVLGMNGIILGFTIGTLVAIKGLYDFIKMKKFSIFALRPKLGFMINNWLSSLSYSLFWWGDKIIIGSLFGYSVLGSYQLAAQYMILMFTIPNAFYIYLLPQESEGRKNKKIKIYSILFSFAIVILSLIFIPHTVSFFFPTFLESILPMQIMSISIIPITISFIYESMLLGKEKSRLILIGFSMQVGMYFMLLITLGTAFGLIGIAISFLISLLIKPSYYFTLHKVLRIFDK